MVALGTRAQAQAPADPSKVRGKPSRAVGQRAVSERTQRILRSGNASSTPHQDLMGIITPSDLHFERHHGGVPEIDPASYSLLIHGLVERPMIFTLAELKRFPSHSQIYFLECSGNLGRTAGPETTPGMLAGLTSTSEWTGVRLATPLQEVGVKPGAKWLRRIEVADQPFMTREETSKCTEPFANGTARMFSFRMDARSLITAPAYPNTIERGWVEIQGIAWTGAGRIRRVDVSTDGGRTWKAAQLQEPVLPLPHTRFRHLWHGPAARP